jgi:hypothetical protein
VLELGDHIIVELLLQLVDTGVETAEAPKMPLELVRKVRDAWNMGAMRVRL